MDKQLVIKRTPVSYEVRVAPDEIDISLMMLRDASKRAIIFTGPDTIWIGTENRVEYQITGWDTAKACLTARRIS
jgi:hypothetical protein